MDVPPIVQELARRVGDTPIAWTIHPDRIIIVFEGGAKLTFERSELPASIRHSDGTSRRSTQDPHAISSDAGSKPKKSKKQPTPRFG